MKKYCPTKGPTALLTAVLIGGSIVLPQVESFSSFRSQTRTATSPWERQLMYPVSRHAPSTRRFATIDEPRTAAVDPQDAERHSATGNKRRRLARVYKFPRSVYRIYTGYAKRLWRETDISARRKIANDKVRAAIRDMQHILQSNYYHEASLSGRSESKRAQLLEACKEMLEDLPDVQKEKEELQRTAAVEKSASGEKAGLSGDTTKAKGRSVLFGAVMGLAVAVWVFSGNYIFTGLFCLMTVLGQLEYYRMVMNTGVYPARRISVIGATSMFLSALFAPDLHQLCLPTFGLWTMIWMLTMRRQFSTISEIATTFTGMFYLGYVPSFWVRLRLIGARMEPTRVYGFMNPIRMYLKNNFHILIPDRLIIHPFTTGSVFIFWSWLSLAFSDVGAYFVGRKYGKTKLSAISPAAGATSPNKSVEGVIGGCAVSALLSILGAWVQKWPMFVVTGAIHGIMLGILGLVGDLTASMLKRDAGLKDFGDLIPEHGGILDRVDSFIWTAPYSFVVCAFIIPALKATISTP